VVFRLSPSASKTNGIRLLGTLDSLVQMRHNSGASRDSLIRTSPCLAGDTNLVADGSCKPFDRSDKDSSAGND
jgi:hypothetical protein